MAQIVIYGAGGNGQEIADVIVAAREAGADWELLGYVDDAPDNQGHQGLGLPVVGTGDWLVAHPEVHVAMGVAHPRIRRIIAARVDAIGSRWATVVHPDAVVSPSSEMGEGCVVFAGAVLSCNSRLGRLVQVSFNAVVHHDTRVGDLSWLTANVVLAGHVDVGTGSFVGMGAHVRQGVSVGEWVLLGSGASVVRDVESYCVAVGVPARPIRHYSTPEEMPAI